MMDLKEEIKNFLQFTFFGESVRDILMIVVLVVSIRTFVVSPYRISGPSMCPTFNEYQGYCNHDEGEYIIVNKFLYYFKEPQRGDVIVFKRPGGEGESFIKRVIGLPGDTVIVKNGYVYIETKDGDSFQLEEKTYLSKKNLGNTRGLTTVAKFEVPEDSYFVLGDNRIESLDSRASFESYGSSGDHTAFVPKANIAGTAWIILWPIKELGFVDKVSYVEK